MKELEVVYRVTCDAVEIEARARALLEKAGWVEAEVDVTSGWSPYVEHRWESSPAAGRPDLWIEFKVLSELVGLDGTGVAWIVGTGPVERC